MDKYCVIAKHWDEGKGCQTYYIAGEFPKWHLADMFKEAYNERFKTDSVVIAKKYVKNYMESAMAG